MVVNATDPVKRFASGSRDSAAVLASLLGDLGSARAGFLAAAASAFLVGVAAGLELANLRPVWLFADEGRPQRSRPAGHAALESAYAAEGAANGEGAEAARLQGANGAVAPSQQAPPARRRLQAVGGGDRGVGAGAGSP